MVKTQQFLKKNRGKQQSLSYNNLILTDRSYGRYNTRYIAPMLGFLTLGLYLNLLQPNLIKK